MIIRNKKNGTNTLAFENNRVIFKANETINIPALTDFNKITNKADFTHRGWFEVVGSDVVDAVIITITKEETNLEKAKKEVREYSKKK